MDRETAISIYKEIVGGCLLSDAFVCLMSPNGDDLFSEGCQLCLRSSISKDDRRVIEQIVFRNHLSLKEVSDKIIIYKPKSTIK